MYAIIIYIIIAVLTTFSSIVSAQHSVLRNLSQGDQARLILPGDLVYEGSFRFPTGGGDSRWPYGASGFTYYPGGDQAGAGDGYPGSLYGIGHDHHQLVAEISIPKPVTSNSKNAAELNVATFLQPFRDITGGLLSSVVPNKLGGLAYLPKQGSQVTDKIYWTIFEYYNVAGNNHDSTGWSELNLSNVKAKGIWHIGPNDNPDFHGSRSNDYMFDVPKTFADTHFGGKYLVSGRHRGAGSFGSSAGPALYAFGPYNDGNPPANGSELDAIALVWYPQDGDLYPEYQDCDRWGGGAWLTGGSKSAVVIAGSKSLGEMYYGLGREFDCSSAKGPHCTPYEPQIIFYDPEDLAAVANGWKNPYEVVPYAIFRPAEFMWDQCRVDLGGAAFDRARGLLYVIQKSAERVTNQYESYPLVHVFKIAGSPSPPSSSCPLDSKFVTDSISGGVSYYTDRTYTITDAGPFSGMEMIKTPNDDKNNTMASDYLNYEPGNSGYLYVAYDRRASSPPNWLTSTFTQIPCGTIHTSLSSQGWLDVYKRSVSFGECVSLGGNKGPGSSGDTVSNYIVLHSTNNVGDQCGSPPPPSSSCPLDSKFVTDSISGGVSYYTDRTYTITDAGPFSGMEMIKTPNDDKNNTMASDYLNYEADNSGYLYVAYDRRASSPPNWLTSTFTQIPCAMIHTSLSSQGWLDVYKRSVSFGECVSLGGNKGPGFSGGTVSNYIVLHGTVNVGDQCVTSCMLDSKFIELGWSVGSTYYTDRGYTITGVSVPDFVNCLQPLIKTPNDDRHNTQSSGYMEFEMPFNGWVYVAFDSRLTIMPSWVYDTGFVRWDGYTISTSLSSQPFMQLYTNYYSAGDCVDLGGNKAPGSSNETASNYSVFLESDGCF